MDKMDKPRICEVMGGKDNPLEPGERFTYPGMVGEFYITVNGTLVGVDEGEEHHFMCASTLINHPDRIIRKPRFTEEEVADAKVLSRALLADGFERDNDGDVFATSSVACRTLLDGSMFPSLRPGQSVRLEDALEAHS